MPHTSRKKKPVRNKRVEVVDEDGWTRVTSSNVDHDGRRPRPRPRPPLEDGWRNRSDAFKSYTLRFGVDEEDSCCQSWTVTPWEPEEGMTVEKLDQQYRAVEKKWLESESWKALKTALTSRVLSAENNIITCVVFGTGSLSGYRDGWIGRHQVAFFQVAAFKAVVDTIEHITGRRPACYAQEPNYNELDTVFLSQLKITKVDHPAAFCLIAEDSFVYTPGAELHVQMRALYHDPRILLSGALDFYWRNDQGAACTNRRSYGPDDKSLDDMERDGELVDDHLFAKLERQEFEISCQILESFKRDHQGIKLPDLDAKDYPFHDMHLWYRTKSGACDEAQVMGHVYRTPVGLPSSERQVTRALHGHLPQIQRVQA